MNNKSLLFSSTYFLLGFSLLTNAAELPKQNKYLLTRGLASYLLHPENPLKDSFSAQWARAMEKLHNSHWQRAKQCTQHSNTTFSSLPYIVKEIIAGYAQSPRYNYYSFTPGIAAVRKAHFKKARNSPNLETSIDKNLISTRELLPTTPILKDLDDSFVLFHHPKNADYKGVSAQDVPVVWFTLSSPPLIVPEVYLDDDGNLYFHHRMVEERNIVKKVAVAKAIPVEALDLTQPIVQKILGLPK